MRNRRKFRVFIDFPDLAMISIYDTRALLCLFLALTHICFIFYFVWVGEEPNLFALFSFISVALYLHMIVFLGAIAFFHAFSRALIKFGIFANFLRSAMAYQMTHRLIGMVMAILVVLGGLWVAHLPPNVRFVRVPIKDLPRPQIGVKFSLLTDVHIGPSVGRTRVQQMVDLSNSLRPDVVAISGDLVDGFARDLADAVHPLHDLKSTYGAYFATGSLRSCGSPPLSFKIPNATMSIFTETLSNGSNISGKLGFDRYIMSTSILKFQILLSVSLEWMTFMPSVPGHTHAGQMYIFVPLVYALNAFVRGLYYDSSSQTYIYVSAGVNYFGPPVKMFGTCEIVLIELVMLGEH
uniref:Calcineurin-like phosphoesterase domain-containing protein n=1 Tax=Parascaris univalens TaxID=6257 RepID=A0A915CA15_PARUN